MKKRKVLLLSLLSALSIGMLAGCGGKGEEAKDTSADTAVESTQEEAKDDAKSDEIVTLKWIQVGNGMPNDYDEWLAQINPYLAEKIGVNIDMEIVPWGDWDKRRSVITNSGEYFDILFTDQNRYNSEVASGVFLDITDMLDKDAPELKSLIPEDYWKAVSSNGKIYGVPTYKDSSLSEFFVWDKDVADKYGVDVSQIHDFETLYPALKKIKDGEGKPPYRMSKAGCNTLVDMYFDGMNAGTNVIGVKYGDPDHKVVNPLADEDMLKNLDIVHKMYKEGIINGDAPTADDKNDYRIFFLAQGWSGAAKTVWGPNMGVKNCEAVQFGQTVVSNKTVQGSINGIYSGCKHPEKALQFLQLVNTDTKVRDLFFYGVEDKDFKYVDGKVERLTSDWAMAGYTQGTFFIVSQNVLDENNQWDEVKELNEKAVPSPLLGFSLDTSNIQTELANCNAVYEKYYPEYFTGAQDPRELIKTIEKELKTAGWDKLRDEIQKQVDAFISSNN